MSRLIYINICEYLAFKKVLNNKQHLNIHIHLSSRKKNEISQLSKKLDFRRFRTIARP